MGHLPALRPQRIIPIFATDVFLLIYHFWMGTTETPAGARP
jgi:hypothetical protein